LVDVANTTQRRDGGRSLSVDLWEYAWILRKRLWLVVSCFIIAELVGVLVMMGKKPIYVARTQLLIRPEKRSEGFQETEVTPAMTYQDQAYLETQYQLLRGEPLARAVIKELHLDQTPDFTAEKGGGPLTWVMKQVGRLLPTAKHESELSPAEKERRRMAQVVREFLARLEVEPLQGTRLVNVTFWAYDKELAAAVTNTLAQIFIQRNLESKVSGMAKVLEWLRKQQEELRANTEKKERALQKYRRENNIFSLEGREDIIQEKLRKLNMDLAEAENERRRTEIAYKQLQELVKAGRSPETHPELAQDLEIQRLKTDYLVLLKEQAEASKKWGPKHPRMIQLTSEVEMQKKKLDEEIQLAIETLKNRYEAAKSREEAFRQALARQKELEQELSEKAIGYRQLQRDVEAEEQLLEEVLRQAKEKASKVELEETNISVSAPALVPDRPASRHRVRNTVLAGLVGLFMGVALAFLLEFVDNSIRTVEDVEEHLAVPFLGWIPTIEGIRSRRHGGDGLVVLSKPESAVAENFRTVRTNIVFSTAESAKRSIMVTSAIAAEGKTTVVANLAIALAQLGRKVVLIDTDLRRPSVHKLFGIKHKPGLTSVLVGEAKLEDVIRDTEVEGLKIITSGPVPPNQTELLDSGAMRDVIMRLTEQFDMCLFDSPPAASVADPLILSRMVGGVIGVIRCGVVSRGVVQRSLQQLTDVNAKILGVVLNNVNMKRDRYTRSYYYRYYKSSYYKARKDGVTE